jgi:hypothetical protein
MEEQGICPRTCPRKQPQINFETSRLIYSRVKSFQYKIDDLEQEIVKADKNLKQMRQRKETAGDASRRHQTELERLRVRDQQDGNGKRSSRRELEAAKAETKKLADRVKYFQNENKNLRNQTSAMRKPEVRDQGPPIHLRQASTAELEASRAETQKLATRVKKLEEENKTLRHLMRDTKTPESHSKLASAAELEVAQAKIRELTQTVKNLEDEGTNLRALIIKGMRTTELIPDAEAVTKFFDLNQQIHQIADDYYNKDPGQGRYPPGLRFLEKEFLNWPEGYDEASLTDRLRGIISKLLNQNIFSKRMFRLESFTAEGRLEPGISDSGLSLFEEKLMAVAENEGILDCKMPKYPCLLGFISGQAQHTRVENANY